MAAALTVGGAGVAALPAVAQATDHAVSVQAKDGAEKTFKTRAACEKYRKDKKKNKGYCIALIQGGYGYFPGIT